MSQPTSRREFLGAGLALPAAALIPAPKEAPKPSAAPPPAAPKIEYRTLGKTGLKVSAVGFGCMITSDPSVITKAAEVGITYFDTARSYQGGNNEPMVGAALKGRRKDVVIATKNKSGDKATALQNLDASLKALDTDYIDVWLLHGANGASDVSQGWIEAQAEAKKAGKVRFAGASTHRGQAEVIDALIAAKLDVVLAQYNFTMEERLEPALAKAEKAGLGVVIMKVMAGGFREQRRGGEGANKLRETLSREGAMRAALKWVLKNPSVHTTIPSMTDMDQLDDNLQAMSGPFGEADGKLLAGQLDFIRPLYCRSCEECAGQCRKGLPVADILRHLSYAEGYGQFRLARESYHELPAVVRAARCSECPVCTIQCPNGVRVSERVARAQELLA